MGGEWSTNRREKIIITVKKHVHSFYPYLEVHLNAINQEEHHDDEQQYGIASIEHMGQEALLKKGENTFIPWMHKSWIRDSKQGHTQ